MSTTTMVHVRVDQQIKEQATERLASMGLSVSDAVRVFLMRVVADKQMPFRLKVPNVHMLARKFEAIVIATLGTALPCFLSGAIVGMFFRSSFWYWALGIAVLAFFYACLDRIPVRLFTGAMKGLPLGGLFWYGYASTYKRSAYYCPEDDWRYLFLYNSDHHKR